ncbi:ANTAR domain-containing protein [Nocardioides astragali]|uniref:ANTAR domain-containing protein n=1 Tax=Nocardioides astragali TaxID=1776736 RepID=A0ABW2N2T0_9ACTN|nr:ANTAR domain-containing protein [Nocardioides astragali]
MFPAHRQLAPDVTNNANPPVDELQRERARRAADPDPFGLGLRDLAANPALIEQAKGALMLHFGVDSHQAFAILLGWARASRTPVVVVAHTLLRGICEGNPHTEVRQRALVQWLEAQLRDGAPDPPQVRTPPLPWRTGT